jgi:hypothetical protein
MNLDEQLQYYEERVKQGERAYSKAPQGIKQRVYESEVLPYKVILRQVRIKAGVPVCWGNVECLTYPLSTCIAGKHDTCEEHSQTCFLCQSTVVDSVSEQSG